MCLNPQLLITRWWGLVLLFFRLYPLWGWCLPSIEAVVSSRQALSPSGSVEPSTIHWFRPISWRAAFRACRTSSAFAEGHIQNPSDVHASSLVPVSVWWNTFWKGELCCASPQRQPRGHVCRKAPPCTAFSASGGWGQTGLVSWLGLWSEDWPLLWSAVLLPRQPH